MAMELRRPAPEVMILAGVPDRPVQPAAGESRLDMIRRLGVIRVGVDDEALPFAFRNAAGQLVGFDVEMAHRLAREMGVRLEFVPIERARLAEHLEAGHCDIAMTGFGLTTDAALGYAATKPYMTATLAVACPDYDRKRWRTDASIARIRSARIAVVGDDSFFTRRIRRRYPQFELVPLPSLRAYFEGRAPDVEAVVMSAEAASAWSLLYPNHAVVVPRPNPIGVPLAYPIAGRDAAFLRFLDHWIDFKQADGTVDELKSYWIYGKDTTRRPPRWCIARDVLGWIE